MLYSIPINGADPVFQLGAVLQEETEKFTANLNPKSVYRRLILYSHTCT